MCTLKLRKENSRGQNVGPHVGEEPESNFARTWRLRERAKIWTKILMSRKLCEHFLSEMKDIVTYLSNLVSLNTVKSKRAISHDISPTCWRSYANKREKWRKRHMKRTMNPQVLPSYLRTQWHATTQYWKEVGVGQTSMSLESTYQNCKLFLINWTQVFWSISKLHL